MEPFQRMESHTLVLSRLHETSDLLRRIARLQQLSKKLQSCQDQVKAAALLNEIGNYVYFILNLFGIAITTHYFLTLVKYALL